MASIFRMEGDHYQERGTDGSNWEQYGRRLLVTATFKKRPQDKKDHRLRVEKIAKEKGGNLVPESVKEQREKPVNTRSANFLAGRKEEKLTEIC